MAQILQISLLMMMLCHLCVAVPYYNKEGDKYNQIDCRLYPYASICRGVMSPDSYYYGADSAPMPGYPGYPSPYPYYPYPYPGGVYQPPMQPGVYPLKPYA